MTQVKVLEIIFDLDSDDDEDSGFTETDKNNLQENLKSSYLGKVYDVDVNEDYHSDILDQISDETGWCINSLTLDQVS